MSTIGVISCSASKRSGIHPANKLYCSPLFKASYQCLIVRKIPVLILSTLYGVITPELEIESYSLKITDLTKDERIEWYKKAANRLSSYSSIISLAGEKYNGFEQFIDRKVFKPLDKVCPIGVRIKYLKYLCDNPKINLLTLTGA